MRVLLSTYGSRGDVEPIAGLAVGLRQLGAEVRVCAPPDREFVDLLAGVGLPLVPFGRPWRSWARPSTAEERTRRVSEFIDAQYDTVAAAARGCDVLLATAMSHFVGRSVAETVDIAHRSATFCPVVLTDDAQDWNAVFGPAINAHRASIGLPPVDDVRAFMFTDHPWVASDPTLGPWQDAADLEAFLGAGTPPVYVGFGSMRVEKDNARAAIEAIRALGRRALVSHGWADLALIDDRDDSYAVGEVNQQALFRRVAAVVHHGGAGTTTTAARAGAPQVVLPQAGDQRYWGDRVAELGIGAAHDGPAPTAESLSAALGAALTPRTRARATAVAGAIRTDGAAVAAKLLVEAGSYDRELMG
jgi:vancomycin aglycone glucosyltransferase